MKLKFINIGWSNANFERCTKELTYEWLLQQVKPYLLSHNIDFEENRRNYNSICRNANCWRNRNYRRIK